MPQFNSSTMDLESLIAQYANQLQQAPQQRTAYSKAELQAEQISIAYVQRNADGSFETLRMNKTAIKAAWTTIVARVTVRGISIVRGAAIAGSSFNDDSSAAKPASITEEKGIN